MAVRTEKIEVKVNAASLKPTTFDGKKGDKYIMWKMKLEADQGMKGLFEAFSPDFDKELTAKEKQTLDLSNEDEKKQSQAVKKNKKAMMQLALAFNSVALLNKINCEKRRDKDWPSGKAHRVMSALLKEFGPEDTMAELEMEEALRRMKLTSKKDPRDLLNELAAIECRYSLELTDSKKKAVVLRLGGQTYSSIIATTTMIHRMKSQALTCEMLLEEMHIQWRLAGGKSKNDDTDSNED